MELFWLILDTLPDGQAPLTTTASESFDTSTSALSRLLAAVFCPFLNDKIMVDDYSCSSGCYTTFFYDFMLTSSLIVLSGVFGPYLNLSVRLGTDVEVIFLAPNPAVIWVRLASPWGERSSSEDGTGLCGCRVRRLSGSRLCAVRYVVDISWSLSFEENCTALVFYKPFITILELFLNWLLIF